MAMESSTLLAALIALASGNLSNFDSTYRLAALEARSQALVALSNSVASPLRDIHDYEAALASCLILSTSEAILGQRTGWPEHLVGAKMIVQAARVRGPGGIELIGLEALKNQPEGEWLLRNFAYHDILGSVTTRMPPLISGVYLRSIANVVDSYMGVHVEVLVFISQISCLDSTTTPAHHTPLPSPSPAPIARIEDTSGFGSTWNLCLSLEQELRAWHPRSDDPVLKAMARAYKGSALVYLYRKMRQYLLSAYNLTETEKLLFQIQCMISMEVTEILVSIVSIPLNAHPECVLLFPLFIAGGEAIDPCDVQIVRTRLRLIDENRGFRNIQRACEVLEEVWATPSTNTGIRQVDWHDVLDRQGGGLLLT